MRKRHKAEVQGFEELSNWKLLRDKVVEDDIERRQNKKPLTTRHRAYIKSIEENAVTICMLLTLGELNATQLLIPQRFNRIRAGSTHRVIAYCDDCHTERYHSGNDKHEHANLCLVCEVRQPHVT